MTMGIERKTGRKHITAGSVVTHVVLIIISLVSVLPFYWIIVSSTNGTSDNAQAKLYPGRSFGQNLYGLVTDNQELDLMFNREADAEVSPTAVRVETVWDFVKIVLSSKIVRAFWNSLHNAILITIGSLLVSSAAGYAFVVYRTKGKDFILKLIMLSMMIPTAATLVPMFRLFSQIGLTNNYWGVVIPALSTVLLIVIFRQCAKSFPRELVEASRIDGLSEFGIFLRVFIPVMRPTYFAAAAIAFINSWNSYFWPLVILSAKSDNHTMPLYIANMIGGYSDGQIMLAVIIATIPTMLVFFLLQKNIMKGILSSSSFQ